MPGLTYAFEGRGIDHDNIDPDRDEVVSGSIMQVLLPY